MSVTEQIIRNEKIIDELQERLMRLTAALEPILVIVPESVPVEDRKIPNGSELAIKISCLANALSLISDSVESLIKRLDIVEPNTQAVTSAKAEQFVKTMRAVNGF